MKTISLFILFTFSCFLWAFFSNNINLNDDWRTANRASAHIAPNPVSHPEAIIQAYSARAFSWRGILAVHTWIAVKPKNATQYVVYQIIGWRVLQGLSPLMVAHDIPDRYWFGQKPHIIFDKRGSAAEALIPKIETAAKTYPDGSRYVLWPGPNSNTFPAYIARHIPELGLTLPATALGKDYLTNLTFLARTPSGTGYQFSLFGIIGISVARAEGLQINILGLVYGMNPFNLSITLPGVGERSLIKRSNN